MHDIFDRVAQNEWEIKNYGVPMRSYTPKPNLETPLSYVVDVEVEKGTILPITYYYITEDEELDHLVRWARQLKVVGYDIETSGLFAMDDRIATLQFGNPRGSDPRAYVIDVRAVSRSALEPVLDLLRDPKLLKLTQNGIFECEWTQFHLDCNIRHIWDTMLAEQVMRAGLWAAKASNASSGSGDRAAYKYCSMAALSQRHLGIDIDKDHDLRVSFYKTPVGEHSLRQIVYASGDVVYPFYIAAKQKPILADRKLDNIAKIEMGIVPVLADMKLTGFRVDVKKWRALWQEAVKKRAEAERSLDLLMLALQPDLFGSTDLNVRPIYTGSKRPQPLNYSSSPQVKWAVKQYCRQRNWPITLLTTEKELLDVKRVYGAEWLEKHKNKTEKDIPDWLIPEDEYLVMLKADKNTLLLGKLRGQLPAELVDLLIEYSKYDIRCSTFGNEFLQKHVRPDTGCVHSSINQCVTATGRLSGQPNLMNIPSDKRYRECFIPKPGYAFVIGDFSQIEPRISCFVSNDPVYLHTFMTGGDLYLNVAEAMLGYRPDIHSEDPEVRAAAKVTRKIFKIIVLSLAYNSGKRTLRDRLTLGLHDEIVAGRVDVPTFEYASELWDRFFEVHAKIREAQNRAIRFASPMIPDGDAYDAPLIRNPRRVWDDFLQQEVTWVAAPCGRKRFFPEDARNAFTEGPNVEPQAGSATMIKAAMWLLQNEIDTNKWDAHIVEVVHDELVVEVAKDQAAKFAPVLKAIMEKAGQHYCGDVPVKSEFPDGTNGVTMFWAKELTEEQLLDVEMSLAA